MHFPPRLRCLVLLFASQVMALPQASPASIPPGLASLIPICGESCVSSLVSSAWPTCTSTSNLDCYCSTNTVSGYTLGESSVQCVVSSCGMSTNTAVLDLIYHVCDGQRGALPETHATLTATPLPTLHPIPASSSVGNGAAVSAQDVSADSLPSSISNPNPPQSTDTTIQTATQSSSAASLPPSLSPPSSSVQAPTTTTSSHPSPTSEMVSASPTPTGALTKGQIAGIAVAGVVSATLSVAAILFCGFLRRQRRPKSQRSSFGFESSMIPETNTPETNAVVIRKPVASELEARAVSTEVQPSLQRPASVHTAEERWSTWRKTSQAEDAHPALGLDYKDFQHTPLTQHTAVTERSGRRASRLLPDKPDFQNGAPAPALARPWSETTEIEDARMSCAESIGSNSSCRTSVEWDATPSAKKFYQHPLGLQFARDSYHPSRPLIPRRPVLSSAAQAKAAESSSSSNARETARSGGSQAQTRTPRNSLWHYSTGSVTSFESSDDKAEGANTTSGKDSHRRTLINYPPIPRSYSSRARAR